MEGLDDLFREPNGPAYVKREERVGPPLTYVQEKMGSSLKALHDLTRSIIEHVPADLPSPNASAGNPYGLKRDYLVGPARQAFYFELVAYLALSNMLGLANDQTLVDRLLGYDISEFRDWIDHIADGSSVSE